MGRNGQGLEATPSESLHLTFLASGNFETIVANRQNAILGLLPDRRSARACPKGSPHSPTLDAGASTLLARAPAQVAVPTLIVSSMSHCTRQPIS